MEHNLIKVSIKKINHNIKLKLVSYHSLKTCHYTHISTLIIYRFMR
jgi:hypothetical protein